MICTRLKDIAAVALVFLTLFTLPSVECANKKGSSSASAHEPTIEEVNAKQLERILAEKDYVAVYWCKSFHSWTIVEVRKSSRKWIKVKNMSN
jgi:hypothetical protein